MRKILALCMGAALILPGCVVVDNSLGDGLVDKSLLYDTHTVEFELTEIQLKKSDALSGYSSSKLTIGAVRDEVFGLTTREAGFPLIPALDTIDLGTNPEAVKFTLRFSADTISCNSDNQARILQNLRVTELLEPLPLGANTGCTQEIPHGTQLITDGVPVYSGDGDLSFSLTKAYAQKYVDAIVERKGIINDQTQTEDDDDDLLGLINYYQTWIDELPGIYMSMDAPEGLGGRINLFNFSCLSVESNYYVRNNNVGLLTVHSTWDGVAKDSTFLFIPGETSFYDEVTYLNNNTAFDQYCFNRTTHETTEGKAVGDILVEGGGGLKPVILASELQEKTRAAIAKAGGDPDEVIIVKASIILPFEMPEDYRDMKYFPTVLSPTIQKEKDSDTGDKYITFAGLTDASVSDEDQGDIDRSNLCYSPDITYHLQELMDRTDLGTATDSDIWLLTVHTEKVANASGSLYDSEYYQQLMYASYYQSLYGGGYGYGGYGYGGYGNNYSNYYNYMMLAQMMNASSQQSYSYTTELDKDRYYCAVLCGPDSDRKPFFRVTYSVPRQ